MDQRLKLQTLLETLLGSRNVYFQPTENIRMSYPCIVYKRDGDSTLHADDRTYYRKKRYQITYIDRNPDSSVPDKIVELPYCSYNTHFVVDGLNHETFSIYY